MQASNVMSELDLDRVHARRLSRLAKWEHGVARRAQLTSAEPTGLAHPPAAAVAEDRAFDETAQGSRDWSRPALPAAWDSVHVVKSNAERLAKRSRRAPKAAEEMRSVTSHDDRPRDHRPGLEPRGACGGGRAQRTR